jgi:hypothetical protein
MEFKQIHIPGTAYYQLKCCVFGVNLNNKQIIANVAISEQFVDNDKRE